MQYKQYPARAYGEGKLQDRQLLLLLCKFLLTVIHSDERETLAIAELLPITQPVKQRRTRRKPVTKRVELDDARTPCRTDEHIANKGCCTEPGNQLIKDRRQNSGGTGRHGA